MTSLRTLLLRFVFLLPSFASAEIDPYFLIEALVDRSQIPRVVSSEDLNLPASAPIPLLTPASDFNGDGVEDMAISGIYNLPTGKNRFFLLVATQRSNPVRYEKLYFKEYAEPVLIYSPGTTGEKDPGNQAFAMSFCSFCDQGFDFYWDDKKEEFLARPWVKRVRRYTPVTAKPERELSDEAIQRALITVGELDDVKVFVDSLKKRKGELGTTVEPAEFQKKNAMRVVVFEKKGDMQGIYDEFLVEEENGALLSRKKKIKKAGAAQGKSK